jgi:hypothetical protein
MPSFHKYTINKALFGSLVFFGIAAIIGLILRLAFSIDLPSWISYPYLKHAHSHIALLGWLFAGFLLAIIHVFNLDWDRLRNSFTGLQGMVLAMTISFPFTGYSFISTGFLGVHMILTYGVVFRIWQSIHKTEIGLAELFLITSLVFVTIATSGTWALPIMVLSGLKGTVWYYGAIQFYLHFMFNGWFIFALLAIFIKYVKINNLPVDKRIGIATLYLLIIATLLTFALAVTWSNPASIIFYLNSLGVIVQLIALGFMLYLFREVGPKIAPLLQPISRVLLLISIFALLAKILIQTAVVLPSVAQISYTIKNFVVGFIHLLMLGCLTLFLFSYFKEQLKFYLDKVGLGFTLFGIITTELLIFLQGLWIWMEWGIWSAYYNLMTLASLILVIGVWIIIFNYKRQRL